MKKILPLFIFTIAIFSCKNDQKETEKEAIPLGDINLIIQPYDKKIDSVTITDPNETEKVTKTFQEGDTLRFNFEQKLNDLYQIDYHAKMRIPSTRIWLDGEKVLVDIGMEKWAKIEKVQNSPLYQQSKEYSKELEKLYNNREENEQAMNDFLLNEIGDHLDSPFSFVPAEVYLYHNKDNKERLIMLWELLDNQPEKMKNHKISIMTQLRAQIMELEKAQVN